MIPTVSTSNLVKDFAHRNAGPKTAYQFALEALRGAIASGVIGEGEALLQNDIALALGISRMPVREALRLLEAEGWVEFSPHKGAVVATLSAGEVVEAFEIRFALEALALRKSVPVLSNAVLNQAAMLVEEMEHERDIPRWVDLNRRFHLCLCAAAGPRLLATIAGQYDAVDRYLRVELAAMDNAAESQVEHRAILAACRARDADRAVALSEPHIVEAGQELAEALTRRRTA